MDVKKKKKEMEDREWTVKLSLKDIRYLMDLVDCAKKYLMAGGPVEVKGSVEYLDGLRGRLAAGMQSK